MLGGSILAVKPVSHGLTFGHSTLEKKKKKVSEHVLHK